MESIHSDGPPLSGPDMIGEEALAYSPERFDGEPARQPAIDRAANAVHRADDRTADAAAPAAQWLDGKSADLRVKQKRALAGTSEYVAANPLKSIGFAALAGLILGQL